MNLGRRAFLKKKGYVLGIVRQSLTGLKVPQSHKSISQASTGSTDRASQTRQGVPSQ
jgi:hypothetical protein